MDEASPSDRFLQRGAQAWLELIEGGLQDGSRHPQLRRHDPVEPLGQLTQRGGPAMSDVLHDGAHRFGGGSHVELGPWEHLTQGAPRQA